MQTRFARLTLEIGVERVLMMRVTTAAALVLVIFSGQQVSAGKFDCVFNCEIGILSNIKWKSTDCHKPYSPSLLVYDVDSYNWAVEEFNSYVQSVEFYLDCITREANNDLKELPDIISEGVGQNRQDAIQEVDDLRSQLMMERSLLD